MLFYALLQFLLTKKLIAIFMQFFQLAQQMQIDGAFLDGFLTGGIIVALTITMWQHRRHKIKIRDYNFLVNALTAPYTAAPISGINDLVNKVAGTIDCNGQEYQEIKKAVQDNITEIKKFFENDINHNKTLCLDGMWGTGKTSSILLALSLLEDGIKANYRFIYESATKYIGGIYEYERDILSSVQEVCSEKRIYGSKNWHELIDNIGSDEIRNTLSLISFVARRSKTPLTTEIIASFNAQYHQKGDTWQLVIILDDIDRLPPDDVYKAITFLSILRRFHFARIVVPADKSIIQKRLKQVMREENDEIATNREGYMTKYLPEESTVKVRSPYQYYEQIMTGMIEIKTKSSGLGIPCAIWAAMLMKFISQSELSQRKTRGIDFGFWRLHGASFYSNSQRNNYNQNDSTRGEIIGTILKNNFEWPKANSATGKFEDIVYYMEKNCDVGKNVEAKNNFNEDFYSNGVASWIFDYANKYLISHKDNNIITFRAINMMIDKQLGPIFNTVTTQAEAFVAAFNILFPNKKISLSKVQN